MQLTSPALLMQFAQLLQMELFPRVEAETGTLSASGQRLLAALSMIPLCGLIPAGRRQPGRPRHDRRTLAAAFLAKAIYNLSTTRQLIERLEADAQLRSLCGWRRQEPLPKESTFSRAFAQFAATELPQQLHAAVIADTQQALGIAHIARDSTAIAARERFPEPQRKKAEKGREIAGIETARRWQARPARTCESARPRTASAAAAIHEPARDARRPARPLQPRREGQQ